MEKKSKLVLAVLQGSDSDNTIRNLNEQGFMVTVLSSTGGFLKKKSTTVMIGVEEDRLDSALELLQKYAPPPEEEPADDTASAAMSGVELSAVFQKLPLRDAALFFMRYDAGYTAAELAQMTGEPAATIRTRLHRIRKQLQQALKED